MPSGQAQELLDVNMAEIKQEIFPAQGGLNWDDDRRFVESGDSRYRLNVIPNEFGNTFTLTNMKGNTVHSHGFTHNTDYAGAYYQVIGDCYDDNRDAVYLFIFSNRGNDSILRFNFSDSSFDKILWDHTGIGLDQDYPICDAFMIGDWLHFNPRSSSPRSVNVQWAYYDFVSYGVMGIGAGNRSVGDYVRYAQKIYICTNIIADDEYPLDNIDSYEFVDYHYDDAFPVNAGSMVDPQANSTYHRYRNFYNIPTVLTASPATTVATDTSYEYNNIRGRRFQFCYRHYIRDQGYTITSPFTGIISAPSSETDKGEVIGDIGAYNKITVTFSLGSVASGTTIWQDYDWLFEFVEVLFREGPNDNWKIAERLDHDSVTTTVDAVYNIYCSIDFFNDKAYEVVDGVAIEKQYNPLPITSNAQWSLDGNRSAYGGNTEGFDTSIDIDIQLSVGERELTLSIESGASKYVYSFDDEWVPDRGERHYFTDETVTVAKGAAAAGDILKMTVGNGDYYKVLSTIDDDSDVELAQAFVELLGKAGIPAFYTGDPAIVEYYAPPPVLDVSTITLYGAAATNTLSSKVGSFKSGAWHPFCLYYYDEAFRRSEPVINETMRVYVDTLPEALGSNVSTNYQRYIDWSIAHHAPSWAKYWRWGYAGNQTIDKFWQYNISSLTSVPKGSHASDTWTRIDISPLQDLADDSNTDLDHYFPDSNIDAYSFVPGDRVRFITNHMDKPEDYNDLDLMDDNYDYEIKEFEDTNNYIYIDELVVPSPAGSTTTTTTPLGADDETYIIEIYRPKKQTGNTVYYEYGDLHKVYESGGFYLHRGTTQDQISSGADDAEGQFTQGDVFVITRLFSKSPFISADNPVFVESYDWSDFRPTDGWGQGKAGAYTGIGKRFLNNVRYSNRYEPNSGSSGLSTFDFLDYKPLSEDHGLIRAMRQAGNTLKIYFERNSASVLVGKTQLYDADGQSQIVKSDKILGDAVYSNYHYGTIFPESVILKDRTIFFFDIYRDAYIKDSPNGLTPISDAKMMRYFDEKSEALLTSGVSNVRVYSSYDYSYDMVYVHFVDEVDSDNDDMILFHEPADRWVTFVQISDTIQSVPTTTSTSSSSSTSTSTSSTSTFTSTSSTSTFEATDSGIVLGKGSMKMVSYVGEDLYTQNTNATRNNLWGSQRNSIVEIISNENPNVKKIFESLAIHSNQPWNVNYVGIEIDPTYIYGMQSKVPEAAFVLREGIYYSYYFRNQLTNQSTPKTLDLIRGELLRGYYLEHRLVNDDTTEVRLFKVDINSNVSRI